MDGRTLDYYNRHAEEVANLAESADTGMELLLSSVFSPGQRVLDVGSGSGRNLAALRKLGAEAVGVEPCEALRAEAVRRYPQLRGRVVAGSLPNDLSGLAARKDGGYDGVLLSAVIMHIPDAELFGAVFALRGLLNEGGALLVSFPTQRGDVRTNNGEEPRDGGGRLMVLRPAPRLRLLFERLGFVLESEHDAEDAAGRGDVRWTSLVFRYPGANLPRADDRLEGILNIDRTGATFRVALVRSFCEIASTGYNTVRWTPSGRVGLSLEALSDLWIRYYWPLFEPRRLIPQIPGESAGAKPVAFRRALTALVDHYRKQGSLGAFLSDRLRGPLSPEATKLHGAAVRRISDTIVKGLREIGGRATGRRELDYDAASGAILIDADLWREIVLTSHWVKDAVILRWAEMTANLAQVEDGLSVGGVVQRLLESTSPLGSDYEIRFIYEERLPLECVWSGKTLTSEFAVDHALPFALWQDGSWWNLFPASSKINSAKSGRLPTVALVQRRREAIVSTWELVREAAPGRFALDAGRLTGRPLPTTDDADWQSELFSTFVEAIEYTAVSRGVPRWEP